MTLRDGRALDAALIGGDAVLDNAVLHVDANGLLPIPIDPILPLIDELITHGKIDRGFLGVSIVNINEALAMNFDLPVSSGVGIAVVGPGSPDRGHHSRVGW